MKQISEERYNVLLNKEKLIATLSRHGVDNWDYYEDAINDYNEELILIDKRDVCMEEIEEILLTSAYEPAGSGCGYATTQKAMEDARKVLDEYIDEYFSYIKNRGE